MELVIQSLNLPQNPNANLTHSPRLGLKAHVIGDQIYDFSLLNVTVCRHEELVPGEGTEGWFEGFCNLKDEAMAAARAAPVGREMAIVHIRCGGVGLCLPITMDRESSRGATTYPAGKIDYTRV